MNFAPYRLLLRGMLVLSPVLLFVMVAELFLWRSGETVSIRKVAREHDSHGAPAAYLPGFIGQQFIRLHYERIIKQRPQVLVLGSSRVMRFRKEMFRQDAEFYNSSRSIDLIDDLEEFARALPQGYVPKTLLLGIDLWWFGERPNYGPRYAKDILKDDTRLASGHVFAWKRLCGRIAEASISAQLVKRVLANHDEGVRRYGFDAWSAGGFRNDGSYQNFDRATPQTHLDSARDPFPSGAPKGLVSTVATAKEIDAAHVLRFVSVLRSLEKKGTFIVGFLPPFAEMTKIRSVNPTQAEYLQRFRSEMAEVFARNGWPLQDGTDPRDLGLDDRCMEDGHHAMETYHIALLKEMAQDAVVGKALRVDAGYLMSLLSDPQTTPWYPVYPLRPIRQAANVRASLP